MARADTRGGFGAGAQAARLPGAAQDAGWELGRLGVRRVMPVTDPGVAALGHPERHHRVGARRRYAQAAALLVIAPKEPSPVDLEAIVRESMHHW